jgi:hypothetical protein
MPLDEIRVYVYDQETNSSLSGGRAHHHIQQGQGSSDFKGMLIVFFDSE